MRTNSVVARAAGLCVILGVAACGSNRYHYVTAAGPMIDSDALIATKRDNGDLPYDQGGPIRIVFPDGTPLSSVLDAWNWSLATINVTSAASGSS